MLLVLHPLTVGRDGRAGQDRDHDLTPKEPFIDLLFPGIAARDVLAVPPDVQGARVRELLEESLGDAAVVAGVAEEQARR